MFQNAFKNKTVLVTGHTGFKGSWLSLWLTMLGAKVIGYSAYLPSEPCNYEVCRLKDRVVSIEGDTRDFQELKRAVDQYRPDLLFHLAAQPIVARSYDEPKLTFDVNIGGTVNILECMRFCPSIRAAVMITSDKCYRNREWTWGYRESDELGGEDPYSASKAGAELICQAYARSIFRPGERGPRIATTRAGNVIGGGDWAEHRIVPDCVRAWSERKEVHVRNPHATRPWQHVLEPLSGYLWLGAKLLSSPELHGEAFNFGPDSRVNQSVGDLISVFCSYWEDAKWRSEGGDWTKKENSLLKLSCDKSLNILQWHPVLNFHDTIRMTAEWYRAFYAGEEDMCALTERQVREYITEARRLNLAWAGTERP